MFKNLANYLLGTSTTAGSNDDDVRLTTRRHEDDWVLVDRDSEGNSDLDSLSDVDDLDQEAAAKELVIVALLEDSNQKEPADDDDEDENDKTGHPTRTSSTCSLPVALMEESWFLTPPPCFTSAGPVHMETSPLENLLIEHPSMSVYNSQQVFVAAARRPGRGVEVAPQVVVLERAVEGPAEAPRRPQRLDALRQQERQGLRSKQAQKVGSDFRAKQTNSYFPHSRRYFLVRTIILKGEPRSLI